MGLAEDEERTVGSEEDEERRMGLEEEEERTGLEEEEERRMGLEEEEERRMGLAERGMGLDDDEERRDEDQWKFDKRENGNLHKFMVDGCGSKWKCSGKFPISHFEEMRNQCMELTHDELDLVIMGQVMALVTVKHQRDGCHFYHLGGKVKPS